MARDWASFSVNDTAARQIYPTAPGGTTSQRASAQTPYSQEGTMTPEVAEMAPALAARARGGLMGQPLMWWGVLVALLFALMLVAKRTGQASEFGNIRLSAYNIVTITLAAMIGFGMFKALFGRVRVPGLSDYVLAV